MNIDLPKNVLLEIMQGKRKGASFEQIAKYPIVYDYFSERYIDKKEKSIKNFKTRLPLNVKNRFNDQRIKDRESDNPVLDKKQWIEYDEYMNRYYPLIRVIPQEVLDELKKEYEQKKSARTILRENMIIREYYSYLRKPQHTDIDFENRAIPIMIFDKNAHVLPITKEPIKEKKKRGRPKHIDYSADIMDSRYDETFKNEQLEVEEMELLTDVSEVFPSNKKQYVFEAGDPEEAGLCSLQ